MFALQLKWFPVSGPYSPYLKPGLYLEFLLSVLHHAFLPVVTYVLTSVGGWILTMKGSTISVLGEYYVTAAEARGLPERRVVTSYVGRNAIIPLFTRFAISVGYMFSGVVFIEGLFLYPGIGTYLSASIAQRDYPLMTGCFLISTVAVVVANFFADILYSRLDPRVRLE
jgi:peptide/nickel transport system permease protein